MANHVAVTIPLENIRRVQVYINEPRKTVAQIKKATGADYILNGTLYNMSSGKVNCHLKVDGEVIASPPYSVAGYVWNEGKDIRMDVVPNDYARNYIACTPLIVSSKKLTKLTYDAGQGGSRGRSAIGVKGGRLALYCTKDGSSAARTPEKLRDELFAAGWESAVMLDGGGSSQCDFAGQKVTSTRKVQHLILVYLNTPPCPYAEPTAIVGRGSVGSGAKWVQWQLNRHGAKLAVDGVFGAKSEAALKNFQKSAFNDPDEWDGKCGHKTRTELKK